MTDTSQMSLSIPVPPLSGTTNNGREDSLAMLSALSHISSLLVEQYERGLPLDVKRALNKASSLYSLKRSPKLVDIISALPTSHRKLIAPLIQAKPIRSASGISVVAVMSKPHRCPHVALTKAVCLYCPGGPDSDFEYSTQAYTGYEPTCLTSSHEVLTPWGWRPIRDICAGDRVWTLGKHSGEWETVLEALKYERCHHQLFCVHNEHVDAVCTSNHRWPVLECNEEEINDAVDMLANERLEYKNVKELLAMQNDEHDSIRYRRLLIPLVARNIQPKYQWKGDVVNKFDDKEENAWCYLLGDALAAAQSRADTIDVHDHFESITNIPFSAFSQMGCGPLNMGKACLMQSYELFKYLYRMDAATSLWPMQLSSLQAQLIVDGFTHSHSKPFTLFDALAGFTCDTEIADILCIVGTMANYVVEHEIVGSVHHLTFRNCTTYSPVPNIYPAHPFAGEDAYVYSLRVQNTNYYARRSHSVVAKSQPFFTGNSMRAIRARYDPYKQTRNRVDQLQRLGHEVDKVEFIVMGGTFMSLPNDYRDYFIRNLHDALSGARSSSVAEAIEYGEQSKTKCIGLTIETRPDWCLKPHLSQMLSYGCTRLEVGVQSVYEDVARDTNRGHSVAAVCQSFHLSKDAGFKVIAHMMPDLPNMGYERDLQQFVEYFENPAFRSDGLKLYPTLVIRGTGLYELWKTGRYKNYSPDELIEILSQILALVPPWTRVYRIQRDIPMPLVTSGVEHGNIRELVLAHMKELGWKCRDIRTREVGIHKIHGGKDPDQVELVRRDYVANGGWETFLAYEDAKADTLIGLLRLRQCSSESFRDELQPCPKTCRGCSIVRELHVYGSSVPVHTRDPTKFQHQGYGTLLMEEAERVAREEHDSYKLAVISGVGTRHYYRKLGYELEGPYMVKYL